MCVRIKRQAAIPSSHIICLICNSKSNTFSSGTCLVWTHAIHTTQIISFRLFISLCAGLFYFVSNFSKHEKRTPFVFFILNYWWLIDKQGWLPKHTKCRSSGKFRDRGSNNNKKWKLLHKPNRIKEETRWSERQGGKALCWTWLQQRAQGERESARVNILCWTFYWIRHISLSLPKNPLYMWTRARPNWTTIIVNYPATFVRFVQFIRVRCFSFSSPPPLSLSQPPSLSLLLTLFRPFVLFILYGVGSGSVAVEVNKTVLRCDFVFSL